jgi:hypothetical protein
MKSLTKGEFSFIRSGYPVSFSALGTRSVDPSGDSGQASELFLLAFGAKTDRQRPTATLAIAASDGGACKRDARKRKAVITSGPAGGNLICGCASLGRSVGGGGRGVNP